MQAVSLSPLGNPKMTMSYQRVELDFLSLQEWAPVTRKPLVAACFRWLSGECAMSGDCPVIVRCPVISD